MNLLTRLNVRFFFFFHKFFFKFYIKFQQTDNDDDGDRITVKSEDEMKSLLKYVITIELIINPYLANRM